MAFRASLLRSSIASSHRHVHVSMACTSSPSSPSSPSSSSSSSSAPLVLFERCATVPGIAYLTLNNPAKRNPLSLAMLNALHSQLNTLSSSSPVSVVVLRANGPAFSAGHDLKEMSAMNRQQHTELIETCGKVMTAIRNLPQPVIAEIQGPAFAAGCQLVASCDLAYASAENSSFSTPGVKIGLFCTTPSVAVGRAVHQKHAMDMLLTGRTVSPQEAEKFGLINECVPHSKLAARVLEVAKMIAAHSSDVLAFGKHAFYRQMSCGQNVSEAYTVANPLMVQNLQMVNAKEGIESFLQKRPPVWRSEPSPSSKL